MNDQELARKIMEGDEGAKVLFYSLHKDRIFKACTYFLGYRDAELEDVAQETFLIGLRQIERYDARKASIYTWLAHICVNLCYERMRHRKRVVASQQEEMEALLGASAKRKVSQREAAAEQAELVALVRRQRLGMEARCREALELRDEQEKSYAAIGDLLKVPLGTVMSRLARCRAELKRRVEAALAQGT